MKVTQADMESRKRMSALRSTITDAISQHNEITYPELLIVLGETLTTWARYLRSDELTEEEEGLE